MNNSEWRNMMDTRPIPTVYSNFPALYGDTVTQGHADYCKANGHGKHTVSGVESNVCPRCGEVKAAPAYDEKNGQPCWHVWIHVWIDDNFIPETFHDSGEARTYAERMEADGHRVYVD